MTDLIRWITGPVNDLDFPGETTTQSNLLNRFTISHSSISTSKRSNDISRPFPETRLIRHHIPIKQKTDDL
ncbi:hypothetical protein FCJ57_36145 [Burkholderia diffusa]|nr:hypothetical protein [Burkholderia diffusa]